MLLLEFVVGSMVMQGELAKPGFAFAGNVRKRPPSAGICTNALVRTRLSPAWHLLQHLVVETQTHPDEHLLDDQDRRTYVPAPRAGKATAFALLSVSAVNRRGSVPVWQSHDADFLTFALESCASTLPRMPNALIHSRTQRRPLNILHIGFANVRSVDVAADLPKSHQHRNMQSSRIRHEHALGRFHFEFPERAHIRHLSLVVKEAVRMLFVCADRRTKKL
ncbi:hypothetical protein GGS21DRAFT_488764 [Xylaria nigripes]|nr:hypothetical protein GGS21DRAFT_488764 [Xylaria nigripes]